MIKPQNPPLGSKQVLLPSFCIAGKPVLGLRLIFWKAASNSGCLQIVFLFPGVLKVLSPCFCDEIRQCLGSTWSSAHAEKQEGDAKMRGKHFGWWLPVSCVVAVGEIVQLHLQVPSLPQTYQLLRGRRDGSGDLHLFFFLYPGHRALGCSP